ncbi:MAG TPA: hypothetical protein VGG23_00740 [Acidimicrobiales bacterium]
MSDGRRRVRVVGGASGRRPAVDATGQPDIWFTNWLDGLLEMGMVCGVLGPIGPIVVPEPSPPSDRRTLSG